MYVRNSKDIDVDKFICNQVVANYLINKCGLPLFGNEDNKYVFIKTEEFNRKWEEIPIRIKILHKLI